MSHQKHLHPSHKDKAWVITADMGYGHQRTAYALRTLAPHNRVINANNYPGIPEKDKKFWHATRSSYEFISRIRRIPIVGVFLFLFMDSFQKILDYYPKRDMSAVSFRLKNIFYLIRKGWGKDLIEQLRQDPLPLVSTFFTPAFVAEEYHYPNTVYCVVCDADTNRDWVPLEPKKSRIMYFAPNTWVRDRLKLYGVKEDHILLTGYPLPKENLGPNKEIAKRDLAYRLLNLDPNGRYRSLYSPLIKKYVGELPKLPNHPLTLLFSIGGAGAQKEIAVAIVKSLKKQIKARKVKIIIAIGVRHELQGYFDRNIKNLKLDGWVEILSGRTMDEYFERFNAAMRVTDILMTKPSELSFYAGLGIPIIIQPPIGSQEDFNKRWLMHVGAATLQEHPDYTNEWLMDMLEAGNFAEMAMQGFVEIENMGTYNIEKVIAGKPL